MRLFETLYLITVVASFLNAFFIKKKKPMLALPAAALFLAAVSAAAEGFRVHVIPAYALTLLFFVYGIIWELRDCLSLTWQSSRLVSRNPVSRKALRTASARRFPFLVLHENAREYYHVISFQSLSPRMKTHKAVRVALITVLIPVMIISVAAPPLLFPVVSLPKPTGAHAVGTQYMSFEDFNRKENFSASDEYRNIPVQVWYPAADITDKERASWISSSDAMDYFTRYRSLPNILGHLSLVKTNGFLGADIFGGGEDYPILIFSGGGAMFYGQNVIQMEELASHGYVVFAVGHPYEDFADVYPDGRIVPYSPEQQQKLAADLQQAVESAELSGTDESSPEFIRHILRNAKANNASVKTWADDISFIVDKIFELDGGAADSIFEGKLDTDSIGALGHSFGGAASGQACLNDGRIKAFVNMDGSVFGDAPDEPIDQPFMVITAGEASRISDGYSVQQRNYTVVSVAGAKHMNFTDLNSLIPVLGKLTGFLGTIPERKQNEITNALLLEFFNRELKNQKGSVLLKHGASEKYITVTPVAAQPIHAQSIHN